MLGAKQAESNLDAAACTALRLSETQTLFFLTQYILQPTSEPGILNPTKALGRKESPLATSNVNPFPAEQPGVYRPSARSEHYQAYPERREQNVHARNGSPSEDSPNLDDGLQSSSSRRPQSCQQQTSDADRDEPCVKPTMGRFPKSGAAFQ